MLGCSSGHRRSSGQSCPRDRPERCRSATFFCRFSRPMPTEPLLHPLRDLSVRWRRKRSRRDIREPSRSLRRRFDVAGSTKPLFQCSHPGQMRWPGSRRTRGHLRQQPRSVLRAGLHRIFPRGSCRSQGQSPARRRLDPGNRRHRRLHRRSQVPTEETIRSGDGKIPGQREIRTPWSYRARTGGLASIGRIDVWITAVGGEDLAALGGRGGAGQHEDGGERDPDTTTATAARATLRPRHNDCFSISGAI